MATLAALRLSLGSTVVAADNTGGKIETAADREAAEETRLFDSVKFLSSDDLEGRGIGTKGLDVAADFMAEQFRIDGLKFAPGLSGPFQKFPITVSSELGPAEKNHLALVGTAGADGAAKRIELKLNEDFTPLAIGGSGRFDLPVVFAGYGITAKDEKYDDFDHIDVKGKAVIILRHEPQQNNPHSAFNGTRDSRYAPIARKVSNAYEHGAAAVLLISDDYDNQNNLNAARKTWQETFDRLVKADGDFHKLDKPSAVQTDDYRKQIGALAKELSEATDKLDQANDPLMAFERGGVDGQGRNFPVVHCRRAALDPMVQDAARMNLAALEKKIDEGQTPTPRSAELQGWRLVGETNVTQKEAEIKNVVAILEGEGPHADETIVIGAHYDHLGRGDVGTLAPGSKEIHNGADDNASGASALVEIARELAAREKKLPRRIVFVAFTGEERGLLGSARYCREPVVPLEQTIAMLNLDMVGRLKDEKLVIYGTGTATEFDSLVDRLGDKYGFVVKKEPGGFGPSDHSSFYAKQIPVLHFFTGSHADYHRPTDDYDKINVQGMRRVADMVTDFAVALAEADKRPQYVEVKRQQSGEPVGDRPYFGSIPDFSQDKPGYALTGVTKGGPAEKAGLQAGDVIIKLGESQIGNLEDFDSALRKWKAGDRVPVVIKRGNDELTIQVQLETPR